MEYRGHWGDATSALISLTPNPDGSYTGKPPADGTPCSIPGLCMQCVGCPCQPDQTGIVAGGKCQTACQKCRAGIDPKIQYLVDPCLKDCAPCPPPCSCPPGAVCKPCPPIPLHCSIPPALTKVITNFTTSENPRNYALIISGLAIILAFLAQEQPFFSIIVAALGGAIFAKQEYVNKLVRNWQAGQ